MRNRERRTRRKSERSQPGIDVRWNTVGRSMSLVKFLHHDPTPELAALDAEGDLFVSVRHMNPGRPLDVVIEFSVEPDCCIRMLDHDPKTNEFLPVISVRSTKVNVTRRGGAKTVVGRVRRVADRASSDPTDARYRALIGDEFTASKIAGIRTP
jgi:hypothetical protein